SLPPRWFTVWQCRLSSSGQKRSPPHRWEVARICRPASRSRDVGEVGCELARVPKLRSWTEFSPVLGFTGLPDLLAGRLRSSRSAPGGHLTTEQVKILAAGIKPRWGPVEHAPSGAPPYLIPRTPPEGAGTGNKEEGLKVFAQACASCHGRHGEGGRYGGLTDGKPVG